MPVPSSPLTTKLALVGAIPTVVRAVAELLGGEADGGVVGTRVGGRFAHQRLAVLLIRVVLAVTVPVADPGLADAAGCREVSEEGADQTRRRHSFRHPGSQLCRSWHPSTASPAPAHIEPSPFHGSEGAGGSGSPLPALT